MLHTSRNRMPSSVVVKWNNDWELDSIPADLLHSQVGRLNAKLRKTIKGGRPKSDKPRCECGKYTLHTAKVSRHKCKLPPATEGDQAQAEVKKPTVKKT